MHTLCMFGECAAKVFIPSQSSSEFKSTGSGDCGERGGVPNCAASEAPCAAEEPGSESAGVSALMAGAASAAGAAAASAAELASALTRSSYLWRALLRRISSSPMDADKA